MIKKSGSVFVGGEKGWVWRDKRPTPFMWAYQHDKRKKKHWNWRMVDAKKGVHHESCVPFALYKWKAFGFEGKQQPVWTIADYVDMVENYEDPSNYVGMGWVGSDGRP